MQCVNGSASWTSWIDQLDGPAGWTSWTDQLVGPAGRTSWTDQIFLFEALASSHIQRFSFQFVDCCRLLVQQRPCFKIKSKLLPQLHIQIKVLLNHIVYSKYSFARLGY